MAVVKDKREEMEFEIAELLVKNNLSAVDSERLEQLQLTLNQEDENYRFSRLENEKRRANYIPFIVELLKISAEDNKIDKYL